MNLMQIQDSRGKLHMLKIIGSVDEEKLMPLVQKLNEGIDNLYDQMDSKHISGFRIYPTIDIDNNEGILDVWITPITVPQHISFKFNEKEFQKQIPDRYTTTTIDRD